MINTVAVVEDDAGIRDLLVEVLVDYDFRVLSFPDGNVECMRHTCDSASVFLVDMMLPHTSGLELARCLHEQYPSTPMLAMSASRDMLDLARASHLFHAVFAKPFDLDDLIEATRRHAGVKEKVA